jgi:hypothetical protein
LEGDSSPSILFMLNEFDIIVLGLESRTDRWKRCTEIFEENKITKVTHFVTQKDERDIFWNATQDYLKMLNMAKDNTVFFEDDFELVNGWDGILRKAWQDLPKDFDMLYLGANLTTKGKRLTNNLVKIYGAWCLHAVIMSRKFIDWILTNYDIDRRMAIDDWMRVIAPEKKFYMTYPMISFQRPGYSDYLGKEVEYNIFEKKYYKKL